MDRDDAREVLLMRALFLASAFAISACTFGGSHPESAVVARAKITQPVRVDARLAVLWIGHATVLVQIDDKLVLTDPFLVPTVGQLSRRHVEPGIEPANIPRLDAVVISHMHFDHLSMGSLELIEKKTPRLFVPKGGLVYIPNFAFDARELATWKTFEADGLRITSVPVKHVGWRYGIDDAWMSSFTGYVIEYHGLTVYFSGDTAYDGEAFRATAARFPHIDVALLPIAPIHPRGWMRDVHMDPGEALDAFADLRAAAMVPMHFDTLVNGLDEPGEARKTLVFEAKRRGIAEKVQVLAIGEQRVIVRR
jgi:L-ascorbate metabolism protein UlaG (beta-lactamase superfamily)